MHLSKSAWVAAWIGALITAPAVFTVCFVAASMAYAALTDGAFTRTTDFGVVLRSMPMLIGLGYFFAGLIATGPALVIGVPTALVLHRRGIRSYFAWGLVGAMLGLLGGFAIVATNKALGHPISMLAEPMLALPASLYGAVTAVLVRAMSGPIPPRDDSRPTK
jgi:hypothetical protein